MAVNTSILFAQTALRFCKITYGVENILMIGPDESYEYFYIFDATAYTHHWLSLSSCSV